MPMKRQQLIRVAIAYSVAVLVALLMLIVNVGGMLPGLILCAVVIGALHLCFTAFEFSDIFGNSGRREVTPPEPDYVSKRTTPD
ncbi:hypothetical protein [Niveibacterium sp.]|uniref:hypothetical protein n=1 Tax=Niveibacterium sp. TaxID=2017444 RepID=UPI0035AF37BD